ncbi:MAG: lipid-A-disaccharide synthase [Desulfomonilaceae bacterium]
MTAHRRPSILLLAGEASGDYHAAAMVRDIKSRDPRVRVTGIGGDALADAGMELLHHYRDINTIGLSEGLGKLRNIKHAYAAMKRELRAGKHDLFVPVDFPDVNLMLCKVAQRNGVPVCYFISPQVWAWRKGRIKKIARRVDRMMTIFPFEEELYRGAGVRADFVGHTMVRDIPADADKAALRRELGLDADACVVALAPGSRPAEVSRLLPVMCEASITYRARYPETRFVLPLAGPHLEKLVRSIIEKYNLPVSIHLRAAAACMGASDFGIVTSGTATLQAALAQMPHAVVYRLGAASWFLARRILKPLLMDEDIHVAIANVLALKAGDDQGPLKIMKDAGAEVRCLECGRRLFVPELLQGNASVEEIAGWLLKFRTDDRLVQAMIKGFRALREMLTPPRGDVSPARVVLECLSQRPALEPQS